MATAVRRSTVGIGRAFEQHALAWCNGALHMSLRPVGGKGDGGVDLRGWWYLPRAAATAGAAITTGEGGGDWRRLRVVGQCKAERKALGPRAVRELEGVVAHLLRREHVRPTVEFALTIQAGQTRRLRMISSNQTGTTRELGQRVDRRWPFS